MSNPWFILGWILLGAFAVLGAVLVVGSALFMKHLCDREDELVEEKEQLESELNAARYDHSLHLTEHNDRLAEIRKELTNLQLANLRVAKELEDRQLVPPPVLFKRAEPAREDQETYW